MSNDKSMNITLRTGETVEVKVGMTFAMHNVNTNRRSDKLSEIVVTKIGRKWITFTQGSYAEYKFDSEGIELSDYGHNSLYLSQEAYDDKVKADNLGRKIADSFSFRGKKNYTLTQLKEVAYILGIEIDETSN